MKKVVFQLIISSILLVACADNKIVIKGTLAEIENSKLYLYEITPGGAVRIDSADIDGKNFKFVISTKNKKDPAYPYYYRLSQNPFNEITTMARHGENLDFQINQKMMVKNYRVSGGDDALLMWQLDRKLKLFIDTVDELYKTYEMNLYDDSCKQKIEEDYVVLVDHHTQELIDFIEKNNHSFAALTAFYQSYNRRIFIREEEHLDLLEKIYFSLKEQYPNHEYVLYLANRLNQKYEH
ncbi:MAG: DUF4369 domain-containing protein [Bacteroidales bacterium]|nr:DUF4369 domain-containing protein [Bacteroidales bacterium]